MIQLILKHITYKYSLNKVITKSFHPTKQCASLHFIMRITNTTYVVYYITYIIYVTSPRTSQTIDLLQNCNSNTKQIFE